MDTNFQPIISTNTRDYRQHPLEFKRALVAPSLEPVVSVARIAREHGVNANQVFSWRRLYEQGRLGVPALMRDDGLLPVVVAPTPPAQSGDTSHGNGPIVLELGEVRVQIEGEAEQLEFLPASFRVIRHVRPKLACACCDAIVQAPTPSRPIERGVAGPGLLAHILVAKFADHLPLYRRSVIYAQ